MNKIKVIIIIILMVLIFGIGFILGRVFIENKLQNEYYSIINNLVSENNTLKKDNESIMKTNEELNFELGTFQRQINNSDTRK